MGLAKQGRVTEKKINNILASTNLILIVCLSESGKHKTT